MRLVSVCVLAATILIAAASVGGCGGSSGGGGGYPPGPGADVAGAYDVAGCGASAFSIRGLWGTGTFDGLDTFSLATVANNAGLIEDPDITGDLWYGVGPERSLILREPSLPMFDAFIGGMSSTGDAIVLASPVLPDSVMMVLTRRAGAWNEADLDGAYHICGYTYEFGPLNHVGWIGVVTFNGQGGGTLAAAVNKNGVISQHASSPITYTVAGDGAVTMDLGLGGEVQGTISKGGDLVVVAGSTVAVKYPAFHVLIRADDSSTDETLTGLYHAVGVDYDIGNNVLRCFSGGAASDGSGLLQIFLQMNAQGAGGTGSLGGTASVVFNGALLFTEQGGQDNLRGAISAAGDVVMLGRVTDPLSNPTVFVLIK